VDGWGLDDRSCVVMAAVAVVGNVETLKHLKRTPKGYGVGLGAYACRVHCASTSVGPHLRPRPTWRSDRLCSQTTSAVRLPLQ